MHLFNKMATEGESNKKWTHERKSLLLAIRLDMEPDFQSKRKTRVVLWQAVLQKIKDTDLEFSFSRDDISRKFLNLMVTYKRIKKRNNTSGEAATAWEYFDELDKVYGSRSDITVPESNLDSSMSSIFNSLTNENAESADSSFSENIGAAPPRKRSRNVLDFLQNESTFEKELLDDLLKCEKEKIEIEKQKLDEIKKLTKLFYHLISKYPYITFLP
ncbi:uncharacterized protein LOC125778954 [Bactrocera dorsalis]|uniref:Uncharacterized protein LOC125778954 n=1 Tax=Bactrocera dorsalis TaxID=27457 RepID=A0ABM3K001_BACDO|nr:uncharacterized protein LOC125778954 [Bactrocera dorsalis]